MACAVYNVAVWALLNGHSVQEAFQKALESIPVARGMIYSFLWHKAKSLKIPEKHIKNIQTVSGRAVKIAALDIGSDLIEATQADPKLYGEVDSSTNIGGATQGFVRVALRMAFWQMLHASSYEDGVLDVVNRGGDADTNGAIAGAMLGARFGLNGIPEAWVKGILECKTVHGGPFDTIYHPKSFMGIGWGEAYVVPEQPVVESAITSPETPKALVQGEPKKGPDPFIVAAAMAKRYGPNWRDTAIKDEYGNLINAG
jgi:hypothetical protein